MKSRFEKADVRFGKVEIRLETVDSAVIKRDDRQRVQNESIAEIRGQLRELSSRVPSLCTIATLIFAIFGASFVLIHYASGR